MAEPVVAEVGCGNGLCLAELARRGHVGHVLGIDMSTGMLRAVRQRAGDAGQPSLAGQHQAGDSSVSDGSTARISSGSLVTTG